VTLFDRLASRHGDAVLRMLTVQYRMHRDIMAWPSRELYEGRLEAHASVAGHLLEQLPGLATTADTGIPLLFIDTAGCGFEESVDPEGESKWNEGEMGIIAKHLAALAAAGLSPSQIGVITPYNAQVDRLRAALVPLYPGLEIGSVDGFQGREKEAVILSLVRSNDQGEIGFLQDQRRLNVALTRARRLLIIVGDSATIASQPLFADFVRHAEETGAHRSAWDWLQT